MAKEKKPKYYTAFIYSTTTEDEPLHCTHRYLGKLCNANPETVIAFIDRFLEGKWELPRIDFTERHWFGPGNDIPVLLPDGPTMFGAPWTALRANLARFAPMDSYDYQPHVTTRYNQVVGPFSGYALMSGKKVIKLWK